jgi:hypothetical protein
MSEARQIYQTTLDSMTQAMLSENPAGFAEYVTYPYEIRTVDGLVVCKSQADIVATVESFMARLKDWNVSEYTRTCDTAKFVTADHISGYHTTRVRSGDEDVLAPFLTRLSLYRTRSDKWKASVSDTSLRAADWKLLPDWLRQQDGFFQKSEASEEQQRLHLFQTILDCISDAFVSGDVEGWLNSTSLPFHMITRQGIETFDTEDAVRKDFEIYRREFEIHGVTEIIREAKTAELIDGDQMAGTYRTHIMRGANHVVPPWDASMTLRLEDGLWRVTTVMRAIGHLNWSALNPADIEDIPSDMTQDTPKKGDHQ